MKKQSKRGVRPLPADLQTAGYLSTSHLKNSATPILIDTSQTNQTQTPHLISKEGLRLKATKSTTPGKLTIMISLKKRVLEEIIFS